MKMHALPIALVALLLTACGDKPAPATTTPAPAESAKTPPPAAGRPAAPTSRQLAKPMPQGVEIKFPYHLRSDSTKPTKGGDSRRVIRVDALRGDLASVETSLVQSMKQAGFRQVAATGDTGSERLTFRKKGWPGRVQVLLAPADKSGAHKKATASITFIWTGPGVAGTDAVPASGSAAETPTGG